MVSRKTRGLPARLEGVRRRFEHWRQTRKIRTRIPESLWDSAVKVAALYGINRTAETLRVDYYSLKERVEEYAAERSNVPSDLPEQAGKATFVELPTPVQAGTGECILELEDAGGAKMRVHLKGVEAPDLTALSRSFWGFET